LICLIEGSSSGAYKVLAGLGPGEKKESEMSLRDQPRANHVLAALPDAVLRHWLPRIERVDLVRGQLIAEPGITPQYVIFPTTAVVAMLSLTEDGHSMEVAVVGNDSVVGIGLILGGGSTPLRAEVQAAGVAYRVPAALVREALAQPGPAQRLLLRSALERIAQVGQTAACNRHHSLEQRLCRWLLMSADRGGDDMVITHHVIADLLGVRREGVTEVLGRLQREGLIVHTRGHVALLDRPRMARRACECYEVVAKECRRLRPQPEPEFEFELAA
jgi:CRP-like cAMP-binding protein